MTYIQLGRKVYRILAFITLLLVCTSLQAQYGSYARYATLLVNTEHNSAEDPIYIDGTQNVQVQVIRHASHGSESPIISMGSNVTEISMGYTPDSNYVGMDTVLVEIRVGAIPILWDIYFAEYVFEVVPSIIETEEDYYTISKNSVDNHFALLSNDASTVGGLHVSGIPALMGGSIDIVSDSVLFTPNPDFQGMAYLTYVACDSIGTCADEVVNICVMDTVPPPTYDTIYLNTGITQSLTEFLPSAYFYATIAPMNGTLEFIPQTDAFHYHPGMTAGIDVFEVSDGNVFRYYVIDVLEDEVNSFVFDDRYNVQPGRFIEFNVQANDRTSNFLVSSYSQPSHGTLTKLSGGNFRYTADSSYQGVVEFNYTVCAIQNCETAKVVIAVDDFNPRPAIDIHHLTGVKNRDLLINYEVPISEYEFIETSPASNGVVQILAGLDTFSEGCVTSIGNFMMIYTPDSGFEGFDEFKVTYCSAEECTEIVVSVEIIDVIIYDTCHCQDQCVWPGDVNFDGMVDMKDLLSLGNAIGSQGYSRPYPEPTVWYGQFGEDWNMGSRNNLADAKHCDTDGNGEVSVLDTASLSAFYGLQHTLVPEEIVTVKPYPIGLDHDLVNPPDSGDTIRLYLTVGTPLIPAKNLSGVAMNVSFDPNTVDTSYTRITPVQENWLTREGLPLYMNKNNKVNFELGLSRVDRLSLMGYGRLFALDIIIDDDIDGIRLADNRYPININVRNAVGMDANGTTFKMPDQQLTFYIKVNDNENTTTSESFTVYPNPVNQSLTVDLGQELFTSLSLVDINGRVVREVADINTSSTSLDVANLNAGVYIVKVQTSSGVKTSKFLKS